MAATAVNGVNLTLKVFFQGPHDFRAHKDNKSSTRPHDNGNSRNNIYNFLDPIP